MLEYLKVPAHWNERAVKNRGDLKMKVKILLGSDFSLDKKDKRVEAGEVLDLPDKIAKALIKNNAAIKFDSKMMKEEEE